MGIDYALACADCLEFIDLHKWSIIEYPFLQTQKIPSLSNQVLFPVSSKQLEEALDNFVPYQPYIEALLPPVRSFIKLHQNHFLFLTCDTGERPWDFGEPRYLEWKEIQAHFNYSGQFLPKNLIQDFGFTSWSEVLEYYSQHLSWFLHEQMKDEREALRQAFERELLT
ncbi:MAG: hypothetical protein ACFCAD_19070 [Pleurocapsa sp.]